jgi:hypothetical protein
MAFQMAPILAGGAAAAVGAGMLGKKKKAPQVDVAGLTRMAEGTAGRKRDIVGAFRGNLAPGYQQFEQKAGEIGAGLQSGTEAKGQSYLAGIQETGKDIMAGARQLGQEQAFRDVPETQRMVRDAMAGTGGLGRGYATSALAQAPLQAARATQDLQRELTLGQQQHQQQALGQIYQTETGAILARAGIDERTARHLLDTGREDILMEAAQQLGIEDQLMADLFGIQSLAAGQSMAAHQAGVQQRSALGSALIGGGMGMIGKGIA